MTSPTVPSQEYITQQWCPEAFPDGLVTEKAQRDLNTVLKEYHSHLVTVNRSLGECRLSDYDDQAPATLLSSVDGARGCIDSLQKQIQELLQEQEPAGSSAGQTANASVIPPPSGSVVTTPSEPPRSQLLLQTARGNLLSLVQDAANQYYDVIGSSREEIVTTKLRERPDTSRTLREAKFFWEVTASIMPRCETWAWEVLRSEKQTRRWAQIAEAGGHPQLNLSVDDLMTELSTYRSHFDMPEDDGRQSILNIGLK